MASEVKADKLSPSTGTALQLGDASDTITIPTGATFTITDGLGVAGGGTGLVSFTAGDVLYATGTTTLAKLAKGSAEEVLSMNSGANAPEWTTAAATAGGTGQTGFTAGDLLYANSTTTLTKLGKGTARQGLQTNSGATAPEWVNSPQSLMTAAGDIIYASGANTLAKLAKGSDDEVLTLASGVPSWAAAGGGLSQAAQFRLTAATNAATNADITTNIEAIDNESSGIIGTGVSESSGIYSFAETGIYLVMLRASLTVNSGDQALVNTYVTIDDWSTDDKVAEAHVMGGGSTWGGHTTASFVLVDVTDTSNVKVKFATSSMGASTQVDGSTALNLTSFTFIRLGDT